MLKFNPAIPRVDKSRFYPFKSVAFTVKPAKLRSGSKSSISYLLRERLVLPKAFKKFPS